MSNATYCARYRDKRHQEFLALKKSVDRLLAENQSLRGSVDRLSETVDRLTEENQQLRKSVDRSPRARVEDESPSTESHGRKKKQHSRSPTGSPEFDAFWAIWPNKVCKQKAFESYGRALDRVTQAELLDGVRRYVATKPDSQNWCHPSTWLNQDRWTDDPAPPVRQRMNGGSNYSGLF